MTRTGWLSSRVSRQLLAVALGASVLVVARIPTAGATSPGKNGRIVFANHAESRHQVFTMRPDGTGAKRVTHDHLYNSAPSWAPGGRWIVYSCSRKGFVGGNICVIRRNGKDRHKLTADKTPDAYPAWSPDGRWIAFAREPEDPDEGEWLQIFLMRRDGSEMQQLTDLPGFGAFEPAWSPNGDNLAFTGQPSSGEGESIWVVNQDGSGLEELTDGEEVDSSPSWSPDGSEIVFISAWTIYTMNADGSGRARLAKGRRAVGISPVWSPNGKKIAFVDARHGGSDPPGIYVIKTDGTGRNRIYYDGTGSVGPDWFAKLE